MVMPYYGAFGDSHYELMFAPSPLVENGEKARNMQKSPLTPDILLRMFSRDRS